MAFNNEIEEVKAQLKVLEKKLVLLEEMEKTKSRKEKDYKRVYGTYPNYYNPSQLEIDSWDGFYRGYDMGYDVALKDYKVGKYQETTQEQEVREWDVVRESMNWCKDHPGQNPLDWVKPQTPEQVADGLKEAFREAVKQGVVSSVDKVSDEEDNDKNFKNSLDLIKEWGEKNKPKTLYQICMEWWDDTFTKKETSLQELVDRIDKEFIPPSSKRNTYEWEKCLKMMRENLR